MTRIVPGYLGDPNYKLDLNRRDWKNGYYVDATGRFVALYGRDPAQLGDGGGAFTIFELHGGCASLIHLT